jgi:hypothetical protein
MECCVPIGSAYLPVAQSQDRLGWDCFVKGRITTLLLDCIQPSFVLWHPRRLLERWGVANPEVPSFVNSQTMDLPQRQRSFQNQWLNT